MREKRDDRFVVIPPLGANWITRQRPLVFENLVRSSPQSRRCGMRSLLSLVILTTLAFSAVLSSAQAAEASMTSAHREVLAIMENANNPGEAYESLTTDQKKLFADLVTPDPDRLEVNSTVNGEAADEKEPIVNGCHTITTRLHQKSPVGLSLYMIVLETTSCWKDARIISADIDSSTGSAEGLFWRADPVGPINSGTGFVNNTGRLWVQHRFIYGGGGIDLQEKTPCFRNRMPRNMNHTQSMTCAVT
ncbi:hypothetical protein [Salininema proteolyticum]|uniref:Uncharacterized protein n=1 Tax=Salininema proteolyticum TaxID=1607685 RepID=A0ABV8TSZ4_9ACTN